MPGHPSPSTIQRRAAVATLWTAAGAATAVASWTFARALLAQGAPADRTAAASLETAPPLIIAQSESFYEEQAAPAVGVTGTISLPRLPSFGSRVAADPSAAARPFSTGHTGAVDRARALECLTAAVHYEAASEGDAGQRAVAQVVLNRVRHSAFPATVCGVVYQGSERRGCQFSFACDGSLARTPSRAGWVQAARNAAAALAGDVYAPVGLATHYHTFAVTPVWNRELVMTGVVGAHFFHRWRGWWGTSAAFRQRYAGGEPPPGAHPSVRAERSQVDAAVAPAPPTSSAGTPGSERRETAPASIAQSVDRLPPAPQVLERWRKSGEPLR